jgi:hypothetical protein
MAIWSLAGPNNTFGQAWQSQLVSADSVQLAIAGGLIRSRWIPDAGSFYVRGPCSGMFSPRRVWTALKRIRSVDLDH